METDLERFVNEDGRAEAVDEVGRRIQAEGITYVYFQFVSVTGRVMGKGIPAAHWASVAKKGFQLVYGATANLFVDRHGRYIGYGRQRYKMERGDTLQFEGDIPHGPTMLIKLPIRFLSITIYSGDRP